MNDSGFGKVSLKKTAAARFLSVGFTALFLIGCSGEGELSNVRSVTDAHNETMEEESALNARTAVGEPAGTNGGDGDDYQIVSSYSGDADNYITLTEDGNTYYMRRPAARTEDSYLESEGAFRFEIPYGWLLGGSELDEHLDVYWNEEEIPCFLWAIEDNNMGANAFSGNWDEVCTNIGNTAGEVFGERLVNIEFRKFMLEDGNEIYGV